MLVSVAIVSISSGPPFLKSCVTLLHSSVFAGQSPTFPNIKPIKIYTFRILYSCQLSCIMRESCGQLCGLRAKDIDLTLEEQFLTLDSQVWNT